MEVDHQAAAPQRVQNLWFEDGGIIVKAGNSLFRSPVFDDMFRIPRPPDAERMEGCAVVELPDAADDVVVFFRAIFDSSFFEAYPAPTTFGTIAGILRLSTKYEVNHLRRRALVHLSSGFPTTLSDWDLTAEDCFEVPAWNLPSWPRHPVSRLLVIQLCREIDAPWILPAAFYEMASIDFHASHLFRGVDNGGALLSFFNGYIRQRDSTTGAVVFLYCPPTIDGCKTPKLCNETKLSALEMVKDDSDRYHSIPLDIWNGYDWDRLADMCATCREALRGLHDEIRKEFWEGLPGMYGLPGRKKLDALKSAALSLS
ncbi:hypothetical protein FB451DRAFT_1299077 [Mycena latifolia]|nr:hypothetical protein FB451DRAFT_1299077 [Mycena latifolia]